MHFIEKFLELRLDIVGIVAILGEGSTSRNAQASALSWHHILPRIYPAPQSLLKHHQDKLLPVESGIVVGAMSGRIRTELNFFTRLLHPDDLPDYSVQMLRVDRKPNTKKTASENTKSSSSRRTPAMAVKRFGHLAGLSILGFCMSITILVLALWQNDGAALVADVLLSLCSSFVGLASWCKLDVTEEKPYKDRKGIVPLGDVVIFYPTTGAFRVIRCTDEVSRFYFRIEKCTHYFGDNTYRGIALFSSAMLMAGLISLSNAQLVSQAAFAASYILLNALYWASSAINPSTHVWQHDFDVKEMGFTRRMIKDQNGKIVPQTSELSPASTRGRLMASKQWFMSLMGTRAEEEDDDDDETTITNRSSQLYFNGNWKPDTQLPRVPTAAVVVQPGRHISLAPTKPEALGWNFAVNMNDILLETMSAAVVGATEVVRHVGIDPERGGNTAMPATEKPNTGMTSALWTVIALTGGSHWARSTNIAPNNAVWDQWLLEAQRHASARWSKSQGRYVPPCIQWVSKSGKEWIQIPEWDYQGRLGTLFKKNVEAQRAAWTTITPAEHAKQVTARLRWNLRCVISLRILCNRWKKRRQARASTLNFDASASTISGGNTVT